MRDRPFYHVLLVILFLSGNPIIRGVGCINASHSQAEIEPMTHSQARSLATTQVSAEQGWQVTGFVAEANQGIRLQVVAGQWTHWLGTVPYNKGVGGFYICADFLPPSICVEPMPSVAQGNLIGKIGTQLFEVRTGTTVVAQQSGVVYLRTNDGDGSDLLDNDGILTVSIGPSTALSGHIVSPSDGYRTGPAAIELIAEASAAGGTGVKQVEFYVFYDSSWHDVAVVANSPYQTVWQIPDDLKSQQLWFRIDVVATDGQKAEYAGGVRRVNYFQSTGSPEVSENWVPYRFYLNQRSLSPDGDSKCSASSMAMVLAMIGLLQPDYQTVANKANEMYPRVLIEGVAFVYKIRNELRRQGAISQYNDGERSEISSDTGWAILKREIDAGRPVIIRTKHGVLTIAGHYLVGVGYRETSGYREVIAYDPYGKWIGKTCAELPDACANNYDRNTTAPESTKGRWVYYDFDKIFGKYLITAQKPASTLALNPSDASVVPPDVTCDEPENIGTYDGVMTAGNISESYLPIVVRRCEATTLGEQTE